jgi:flagellar FliL protein
MPAIRDRVVMLFSRQQSEKLESPEGKEQLRAEILAGVQGILEEHTGSPGVEAVYFTSFVMQ